MKEEIEKKLQENIERILKKEELDKNDVAILKDELNKIENENNKEEQKKKKEELNELFLKVMNR